MKKTVETDIVIVGGGIAGLWLLNRLRHLGFGAILLESHTLGGGQTHKAQGIIHGGMKYALQGAITQATNSIADMPAVWKECLAGIGEINLKNVPILSQHQYLWSTGSLASKLAGFFASLTLKGQVTELKKSDFPEIFQAPQFKGQVYALDEIVLDINSLVRELVKQNQDVIFKIDPMQNTPWKFDEAGRLLHLNVEANPLEPVEIKAQKFIFTAGSGNEFILQQIKNTNVAMQKRPLHMVVVQVPFAHALYAHCLGLSATPRITITTHRTYDGKMVWYLGGQIAEEGVKFDSETQIDIAKKELQELFPWLDFFKAKFASFMIDRAEPLQPDGKRPDSSFAKEFENMIIAWPTKLALAPKLSDDIIQILQHQQIKPYAKDIRALRAWPMPILSKPIWDQLL